METATMGRVTVEATIENIGDLWDVKSARILPENVRRVVVPDALVDTGASTLSLPTSLIQQLGLYQTGTKPVTSSTGPATASIIPQFD